MPDNPVTIAPPPVNVPWVDPVSGLVHIMWQDWLVIQDQTSRKLTGLEFVNTSLPVGTFSKSPGENGVSVGISSDSGSGSNNTVVGQGSVIDSGSGDTIVGQDSSIGDGADNCTVVGQGVEVGTGDNNTVVGQGTSVGGSTSGCTIVGKGIASEVDDIVAVGNGVVINTDSSGVVAIGNGVEITGINSICIGDDSVLSGIGSTLIGARADTVGVACVGIGNGVSIGSGGLTFQAVAIGAAAVVGSLSSGSIAIGNVAVIGVGHLHSLAVGKSAASSASFEATFGDGATSYYTDWRIAQGANGQRLHWKTLTELTTIAAAATTDTTIQIPQHAVVLGVTTRVTIAPPGTATMDVGVAGATTRFATGISTSINETYPGTDDGASRNYSAAASVRITPNASPSDATGRIRVTIHYYELTPATN